ncbi:serine protease persephone-like isoform X2 [Drosophila novamexicana]|uniref:serine protease persephone-like isoform X2 n=1 Tax=Drosophila novamexicana TaxID=47314 RepID=UPI0011E5A33D|nr:serine protease persephone-like isoform X2 [Drosophila novamexicana]
MVIMALAWSSNMSARRHGLSFSLASCRLLLCGLILCAVSHLEAREGDACMVKENLPGVCQTSSKCEPRIDKYIKTGKLTVDKVPSCGLGPYEEIVCCPTIDCCEEDKGPETTTIRTIQATPTTRVDVSEQERPAVRACRLFEELQKERQREGQKEALTLHILDGIPVEPGVYPHMAAIAFSNFGTFVYRCGGSLISNRHVLTAAHCFNEDLPVHARLGTVDIEQLGEFYQDIAIKENIAIHPEYVSTSKYNDIAILELVEEPRLSLYISPACLETNLFDPPETAQLFVAGWGTMNQTTRRQSKILLRAPLNTVPLDQCNVSFSQQPNTKRFLKEGVIGSLFCAADRKFKKADACQGDSGGPLMLERDIVNNKYSIVGIISSGFGCATKTPGLYTRVASYLGFIEQIVWPNNVV